MDFLERNLEDIIFENRSRLHERGLKLRQITGSWAKMERQVQLGSYGVADLVFIEGIKFCRKTTSVPYDFFPKILSINIIECKLNTIDIKAYLQAKRYAAAIREIIDGCDLSNTDFRIHTTLIGSKIEASSDFVFALNEDENCSCFTYKYDFEGIVFNERQRNWRMTKGSVPKDKIRGEFMGFYKQLTRFEVNNPEVVKTKQTEPF